MPASKASKAEWIAKSVDVDPRQWKQVRARAAEAGVEIREWLKQAIAAAMKKEN